MFDYLIQRIIVIGRGDFSNLGWSAVALVHQAAAVDGWMDRFWSCNFRAWELENKRLVEMKYVGIKSKRCYYRCKMVWLSPMDCVVPGFYLLIFFLQRLRSLDWATWNGGIRSSQEELHLISASDFENTAAHKKEMGIKIMAGIVRIRSR